jgi:hypothetical protein
MESYEMIDFTLHELLFVIVTGHVASRCCEQIVDSIPFGGNIDVFSLRGAPA